MRDQRPIGEAAIEALAQGRNGDPFALLGPHREGEGWVIRALLPGARAVTALAPSGETLAAFRRVNGAGLFEAEISEPRDYRLCIDWDGVIQETEDPCSFPPLLGELDIYLLAEGRHCWVAGCLGAHPTTCEGILGVRFAVSQTRDHDIGVGRGRRRGFGKLRAEVEERRRLIRRTVPDDERMAGPPDVGGHRGAHLAESDKCDRQVFRGGSSSPDIHSSQVIAGMTTAR